MLTLPEEATDVQPARVTRGGKVIVTDLPLALPERDVRRKRPPVLGFLLRWETLRRLGRIALLLAIDGGGVFAGIFTALAVKSLVRLGSLRLQLALNETRQYAAFAVLVCVLLFARSQMYASRAQRPGFTRIVTALFQTMLVAAIFAVVKGERFQSYWIFYGSLFFAAIYISAGRYCYDRVSGLILRAAGYHRRTVLVGSGRQIEAVAHALADSPESPIELVGYLSLTPRPENGLRSLGDIERLPELLAAGGVDEVIVADADFPQQDVVDLVDICHQRGVNVRIALLTMEILMTRAESFPANPCRYSSSSRRSSRVSTTCSSAPST